MTPHSPFAAKARRVILVGIGSSLMISALVGGVAAWRLIEPSDEEAIGLSRNQFLAGYAVTLLCGLALIWLGFRRRK